MKQQRFEIGQAVTRKSNKPWKLWRQGADVNYLYPKFGRIYHVRNYTEYLYGHWMISFVEGDPLDGYDENDFDPVINTDVHIPGIFSESIAHRGAKAPHLHDHKFELEATDHLKDDLKEVEIEVTL